MLSVFLFVAAGCATPYQPDGLGGGYSSNRIDSDTISVAFQGNRYTSQREVEMYLLYRCAEVTRDSGYDYFIVLNPATQDSHGVLTPTGTFGSVKSLAAAPVPTQGSYFPGQTISSTSYGATTLIRMGTGKKPAQNVAAYNAQEVIEYVGPQINESAEETYGVRNNLTLTQADPISGQQTPPPSYHNVYTGALDLDHDRDNP